MNNHNTNYQTFLGIDLHKRSSHLVVTNQRGEVLKEARINNREEEFGQFLALLQFPVSSVAEATRSYYWLYQLMENKSVSFTLANPLKTRAIAEAKIKTDSLDAKILAHLLRSNLVASAYIPTWKELELREFLRYRVSLVRIGVGLKNKTHAILGKNNIHHSFSDLFGSKGKEVS